MIDGMEGEEAKNINNNNNNISDENMDVKIESTASPEVKEELADTAIKCEPTPQPSPSPSCSSSSSSFTAQSPLSSPPAMTVAATATSSQSTLFQPFLPSTAQPQHRSALPFSIDNILKPTFGQRLLLHSLAAAAAAAHHHQQQQQQQQLQQQLLLNRERTIKRESPPPTPRKSDNQPVDLSSSSSSNNNNSKPSEKKGESDLSAVPGQTNKTDPDVPPGMVRGPNGQLWPAWVFCTRYSDRPSSGE